MRPTGIGVILMGRKKKEEKEKLNTMVNESYVNVKNISGRSNNRIIPQ